MSTSQPVTKPATTPFQLTRTFDAPRDLVWKVMTEKEHLPHWWGPKGFTITVAKLELRPGGVFHYCMALPHGNMMWGKFVYQAVEAPERLVFLNSFSDADEGITRAPFSGTWPLEMYNEWRLTEENGRTTLHITGGPGNATDTEKQTYRESIGSMQQGFNGTFDQLETYLKEVPR